MAGRVVFHQLVQRDMDAILRYYEEEASAAVADRFFTTFLRIVDRAAGNPRYFHPMEAPYRRANLPGFPYHFLYRETSDGIRVLVLRHDRRHPSFGMRRR